MVIILTKSKPFEVRIYWKSSQNLTSDVFSKQDCQDESLASTQALQPDVLEFSVMWSMAVL